MRTNKINFQPYLPRESLVKNSFFLWSQGLILFLTGMPVVCQLSSYLLKTSVWSLPKIYELKLYMLAMFACFATPLLHRFAPVLLLKDHPRYQFFMLGFYPCEVLLYSLALPDLLKYSGAFALALLGVMFLIYDMCHKNVIKDSFFNRHFSALLIISIALSTLVILCKSDGNTFDIFSVLSLSLFVVIFLILRFTKYENNFFKYIVPIFLLVITFGTMQGAMEMTHYSFFLGPVIEILYGHLHPLAVEIQYGGGLTSFLAAYFKLRGSVTFTGLQDLLKFLAFIQYLLIYFISVALYRSQKIAFLTMLAVLLFSFFAPNMKYYYCGPSIGFLRFGFIYLILLCYALEGKSLSTTAVNYFTAILGSVAVIWSFDSAIYTLPALLFAEYMDKNLRKFLPIFLSCFLIITFAYLSPFFLQGTWPPLWRYYEYAFLYVNGFGQISLDRLISLWWLFPLLYGFFLLKITAGDISNKIISALTVYGILIFTYFASRSAPQIIYVVSIPFVLLSIYLVSNLKTPSLLIKQALQTCVLVIFTSAYYVQDNQYTLLEGVWKVNLPILKNFILMKPPLPFIISDSGSSWLNKTDDKNVKIDCAVYSSLNKYLKDNTIAILSTDDKNLINFYTCTKSHNALALNPYYATSLNPKAALRMIKQLNNLDRPYILVETNLIENKQNLYGSNEMMSAVLEKLHAVKVGALQIDGSDISIFQTHV